MLSDERLRELWMEFYNTNVSAHYVPKDRGRELPELGVRIENEGDEDIYCFILTESDIKKIGDLKEEL